MTNKRAHMKVWPILFVCQATKTLHVQVAHNYGMKAFSLQYDHFLALRDAPQKVVSEKESQLTSGSQLVTRTERKSPTNWEWKSIGEQGVRQGTTWEFVPAGCQYRNGLAESRVKAVKNTLGRMMNSTLIGTKPTLSYAELCTTLARAASIISDRPNGVRSLTEDEIVLLTVNQLLLGRSTTTTRAAYTEIAQAGENIN